MGKINSLEIDNIIHAEEIVSNEKEKLIKLYLDDYGSKYQSLICERLENTVYVFDTTPDIAYEFFLKHETTYNDTEDFYQLERDAREYKRILNSLLEDAKENVFQMMCQCFGCSYDEYYSKKDDILELPIHVFSSSVLETLEKENDTFSIENNSYSQQKQEYYSMCDSLNLNPLIDSNLIDKILDYRQLSLETCKTNVIKRSNWGIKKSEELSKKLGVPVGVDNLESFYQSYPCFTDWFESKKNAVCIPLVKYFSYIDLDSTFLHELRHSIECDKQRGVGVTYITNRHYDLLNEIRTEKLAIRDSTNKKFSHFNPSGESVLSGSLYEQLFFLTGDLFERNVDLWNQCAITNDVDSLEEVFDRNQLFEYTRQLVRIYREMQNYFGSLSELNVDKQYFLTYVDLLNKNAEKNKKLIYRG